MKKYFTGFLSILFLLTSQISSAQTQLLDDFDRSDNTSVGGSWTEVETATAGASVNSSQLRLGNSVDGREYIYADISSLYNSTLNTNSTPLTWSFNMRQSRTNPSGFNSTYYGVAFVLGCNSNNFITGDGYAVVHGEIGANDYLHLVKFTGGLDLNSNLSSIVTGSIDYGADYFTVKVVYDPSGDTWSLYIGSSITSFNNPSTDTYTQVGSTNTDNTYTGSNLNYLGCFWNHNTSSTDYAYFDNIGIPSFISTSAISGSPFCVSGFYGANVSVAFSSTLVSGVTYTAQLSDATGDFTSPTILGSSNISPISGFIPASTAAGTQYRIRVISGSTIGTDNGTDLTIIYGAADVSNTSSISGNAQVTLSWTNPSACYDEIMIVAAPASISAAPSGNGSSYTAHLTYGSGTSFGGGYVVYKGLSSPQAVTGLTNGTEYYFKFFTRKGTIWSSGIEIKETPNAVKTYYSRNSGTQNDQTSSNTQLWSTTKTGTGATQYPLDSTANYVIQNGHTVELRNSMATSTSIRGLTINDLTVESGAKFWTATSGSSSAKYICIKGNIVCDGIIGNGITADAISFNIADGIHSIMGIGKFDCSRITKSDVNTAADATLTFEMNVNIEYYPGTGIYNKQNANTDFNVIINNYITVSVSGDVAIDGATGSGSSESGGTYFVYGTLDISGELYLKTNNIINPCALIIGTSIGPPALVSCSTVNAGASGNATHTLNINSSGTLEITGLNVGATPPISPFSTTNNVYTLNGIVEYSGGGDQSIETGLSYYKLTLSGSGIKDFSSNLIVSNNLLVDGSTIFKVTSNSTVYTLFLGGNFTLQNGADMDNLCRNYLAIETNSSTTYQAFDGNGQSIRCFSFNFVKTEGSLSLASGTDLDIKSDFYLNFSGVSTSFSDGSNLITVGDDAGFSGSSSCFNFTGTIKFTFETSTPGDAHISDYSNTMESVAKLNNLVIDASSAAGSIVTLDVYPLLGTRTITVNGDITIANTNYSSIFDVNGNTINIKGNWTTYNNSAFTETNSTIVFNGTSNQAVNSNNSEEFWNMSINNSFGLTLNTPISIFNQLNLLSGKIYSNSVNLLSLENNSSVANVSHNSFVSGPVKKVGDMEFTFPVGKNSYYRPIMIEAPLNVSDAFTAEYFEADPHPTYDRNSKDISLDHISQCEYWILDRTTGSSNVEVSLSWDINSCGISNLNDLRVARWDGIQWKDHGNSITLGNTSAGTVMSSGVIPSFSPFTLASSSIQNPLPLELLYFDAKLKEDQIDISWVTASEINTDYFVVDKSEDGINFNPLIEIPAKGYSTANSYYETFDNNPSHGINYYRLTQIDFDNTYTYSNIISVDYERTLTLNLLSCVPNPFSESITVICTHNKSEAILIQLRDVYGKLIYERLIEEKNNLISYKINTEDLSQGVYFIILRGSSKSLNRKIIKH